jgi:hypothetical protein
MASGTTIVEKSAGCIARCPPLKNARTGPFARGLAECRDRGVLSDKTFTVLPPDQSGKIARHGPHKTFKSPT